MRESRDGIVSDRVDTLQKCPCHTLHGAKWRVRRFYTPSYNKDLTSLMTREPHSIEVIRY